MTFNFSLRKYRVTVHEESILFSEYPIYKGLYGLVLMRQMMTSYIAAKP